MTDSIKIGANAAVALLRQPVESRRAEESRQVERQREAQARESQRRKVEDTLQPVANAQGQVTGTLINVIA